MTADQADARATGTRADVDEFLADLDAVLAAAHTVPAPAAPADAAPDAAATMPDVDLDLVAPADPEPAEPARELEWWEKVYDDDQADVDTWRGHAPPVPADAPPRPDYDPDPAPVEKVDDDEPGDDADDQDGDDAGAAAPKKPKAKKAKKGKGGGKAGAKKAGKAAAATAAAAADGVFNNPKGRRVLFAGTAYGLGWGLGLDDRAVDLMAHAADYAMPVAGGSLVVGLLGLMTQTKFGGLVFVGSLGLVGALAMVDPARIVGGGLALGLQIAYRAVRGWIGHHGDVWPWKGVVWLAHVPAATATVAFILYGTN